MREIDNRNKAIECACIGCTEPATHEWGGRPHCEDCMPPMYKLGKHKYVDGAGNPREDNE